MNSKKPLIALFANASANGNPHMDWKALLLDGDQSPQVEENTPLTPTVGGLIPLLRTWGINAVRRNANNFLNVVQALLDQDCHRLLYLSGKFCVGDGAILWWPQGNEAWAVPWDVLLTVLQKGQRPEQYLWLVMDCWGDEGALVLWPEAILDDLKLRSGEGIGLCCCLKEAHHTTIASGLATVAKQAGIRRMSLGVAQVFQEVVTLCSDSDIVAQSPQSAPVFLNFAAILRKQLLHYWHIWRPHPTPETLLTGEWLDFTRYYWDDLLPHLSPEVMDFIKASEDWQWQEAVQTLTAEADRSNSPQLDVISEEPTDLEETQPPRSEADTLPSATQDLLDAIMAVTHHLAVGTVPARIHSQLRRALESAREWTTLDLEFGAIVGLVLHPLGKTLAIVSDVGHIYPVTPPQLSGPVASPSPPLIPPHRGGITAIACSPDGHSWVSGGNDGSLSYQVGGMELGQQLSQGRIQAHDGAVLALAIASDGMWIASAAADGAVSMWLRDQLAVPPTPMAMQSGCVLDQGPVQGQESLEPETALGTLRPERVLPVSGTLVRQLCFADNGRYLVGAGAAGKLLLWDLGCLTSQPQDILRVIRVPSMALISVASLPDGVIVAGDWDGYIGLWHRSGELQCRWSAHDGPVTAIATLPEAPFFASAGWDGTVAQWRRDGSLVRRMQGDRPEVLSALAIAPDGDWMVSGSRQGIVRFWDARLDQPPSGGGCWSDDLLQACLRVQHHPRLIHGGMGITQTVQEVVGDRQES